MNYHAIFIIAASLVCSYFFILTISNILFFRKYSDYEPPVKTPRVSVIIPARNEESRISECLESLVNQDYPDYEVLVIDDQSSDKTWEIISGYARAHPRIRAFKGKPLPPGWKGKQHACQQLVERAAGEYYLFTDADTVHNPRSVSWVVGKAQATGSDFVSGYPRQKIKTIGESLVIPAAFVMTSLILPLNLVPGTGSKNFSFAIGQFMLCSAHAFRSIGGYSRFKNSITEDLLLAKEMKKNHFKTIFLDAQEYVSCRMYNNYIQSFIGIARSIYTAVDKNMLAIAGMVFLIAGFILLPFLNLVYQFLTHGADLQISAFPVVIFTAGWSIALYNRKLAFYIPFLYPLLFLNLLLIAFYSVAKTGIGKGIPWKGRLVK